MELRGFNYKKKNGEERKVNVMVLNEQQDSIAGIDVTRLTEKEGQEVFNIQKEYEEKLKPFMKAYRKFLKEGILEE
jgi:2-oxo-4-hydroxy-4-carboxy--5-ureidoimidazoline (OHCU) decarboxylase